MVVSYETLLYDTDGRDRDDHAEPPRAAEHDRAADARRVRGRRAVGDRRPGQGDRAARRRARVLRRLRLRRRLSPLGRALTTDGRWDPGKDFVGAAAYGPTQKFMSMWRTPKPVIAQVHGWCVGGGSDMALCADLIIASEDAQIGTPYSRDLGLLPVGHVDLPPRPDQGQGARADREAAVGPRGGGIELINAAVPFEATRGRGRAAGRAAGQHPALAARRDEADRQSGLREHGPHSTQTLGPILDGLMRNTPDAEPFIERADRGGRRRRRPMSETHRSATTARRPPSASQTHDTSSRWTSTMNSPKSGPPYGTLTAVASVSQGRPGSTCHRMAPARPGADRCRTPAARVPPRPAQPWPRR